MDKKDVVHIHNGMLLRHKKEWNNVICTNIDGPRDYQTKCSKSDRGRQISDQIRSDTQSCLNLCDPMNRSTTGLPVHHQLPEFTQTHVHWVGDAIQPSHPLSSPSPPAPNPSQHQSFPMSQLFAWGGQSIGVSALHHSFQRNPRSDLL